MGKVVIGFLIGLLTGLVFADIIFPEGFPRAVQQWGDRLQSKVPGR